MFHKQEKLRGERGGSNKTTCMQRREKQTGGRRWHGETEEEIQEENLVYKQNHILPLLNETANKGHW